MKRAVIYSFLLASMNLFFVSCVTVDESKRLGENIIETTVQKMEYGDNNIADEYMVSCKGHIITKACKHPDRNIQKYCFQNSPCHKTGLEYFFKAQIGPEDPYFIFLTASGAGNLYYNISYLVNLPANLIAEIHYDWAKSEDSFLLLSIIINFIYALWGLLLSCCMLVIGSITGLILHPINTIFDCIFLLPNLFVAIWAAISNFFSYIYIFFTINPWTI